MDKHMQQFHFAELNIRHRGNAEHTLNIVRRAVRMGYDAICINVDIGAFGEDSAVTDNAEQKEDEDQLPPKKKRRKQKQQLIEKRNDNEIVPDPFLVDESKLDLSAFAAVGKRFRQFSRLTTTIDAGSVHRLQHHKKVKQYDVLAVRVPDEQLLLTLQRKGDFVDLISLDESVAKSGRLPPWLFKQKIVQSCIDVGITFELCYGHALTSSENRRQFFTTARRLVEITRGGRGVVLSSGAEEMISLRGPFDVSNLSALFGLAPRQGRKFVASNARAVLLRSQTRRHTIRGAMHMAVLEGLGSDGMQPSTSTMIPSATGASATQTLAQLAQIEEFAAELGLSNGKETDAKNVGKSSENERIIPRNMSKKGRIKETNGDERMETNEGLLKMFT